MALIGVITGDLVDSTKIEGDDRTKLLSVLRSLLSHTLGEGVVASDIFRGDGFQVVVANASRVARVALSIRSGLISGTPEHSSFLWDARLSVGVGMEEYVGDNVGTSDGIAFRLSGRKLDEMKNSRLSIITQSDYLNEELAVEIPFVDDIVSSWTKNQAYVSNRFFELIPPQSVIVAKEMSISTQRVNRLYHSAKVPLLLTFLNRFETVVNSMVI